MSPLVALFPDGGREPRSDRRAAGRVALAVLAVAAGTAVALLRVPHAFDTTWAEDGHIFLADAVARPLWTNLVTPYSGYLHVLPRLVAELVALAPPAHAAAGLAVVAALCSSVLALLVFQLSGAHLPSWPARLAVSAPMLLLPFAQAELPLSLATLRWQLMYVMFWALLGTPQTPAGQVGLVVLAALMMTSDNVVILFLPLAMVRWWVRRDRLSAALVVVVGLGTVLNVAIPLLGIDAHTAIEPRVDPFWAAATYVLRPLPQVLFGDGSVGERPGRTVVGLAVTAAAWGCVAGAALVARRRRTGRWPLAVAAAVHSLGLYLFVVMVGGYALSRYSVPAALLLVTVLTALLAPAGGGPALPRVAVGLGAAAVVVVSVLNFRTDSVRSEGPLWSDGLRAARVACAAGEHQAGIPVSPVALGWAATLPCDYVMSTGWLLR